jgi:hypothetical protein
VTVDRGWRHCFLAVSRQYEMLVCISLVCIGIDASAKDLSQGQFAEQYRGQTGRLFWMSRATLVRIPTHGTKKSWLTTFRDDSVLNNPS